MPDEELRSRLNDIILDRIRSCRYPSSQLMDRLEASLIDREEAQEYVEVLFGKLTKYPSLQLLDRISWVVSRIEMSDA